MPSRVGAARARQLLMFATALDATEALQIGLVDDVVDAGHALDKAHDDAQRLACGPATALRTIKTMLADSGSMYPLEVFDREAHHQGAAF